MVHSSWIAELQISSRDCVSVSPRSCVDFARSAQAEIVYRFRPERTSRDHVSISPGDRLEFVGDQLRFEKSSPRWRIVGRERKSRKSTTTRKQMRRISSSSSRTTGRPDRSTDVHQRAQAVAVDRPVDRLTLSNSRLGTVDRDSGRSTSRSTDRRIWTVSESFLNWKRVQ